MAVIEIHIFRDDGEGTDGLGLRKFVLDPVALTDFRDRKLRRLFQIAVD